MAADGSIVIDTRIDTAGFGKGAANLKSQFAALGTSAKKLGGLIAAAFSVTAIANFAKEAIELGSDLQEVQNVVDVTFTTLNEQVNEFAKNAATTAGLSETMAKQYVGTFGAMAKSFQFTEEEAYNMSTALTQLAGDVASFYNITQDSAYTKLKSVFTGETESLKDLGVVMTQTALDDYALRKGLGKTTSEMTEQEKVALRYQFVLEQLSAASGDFIRTQDGWANQTRILSLQFDQLKATLGQGLINALTPAIKVLNQIIAKLQTAAEAFRDFTAALFGDAGDASSAIESATESTEEYGDATEEAAKQAKKALAPFDEITKLGSESSDTETTSSVSVSTAVTGSGETITAETIAPGLQDAVDTILEWIEPLKDIDFSNVSTAFDRLKEAVSPITEDLFSGLKWAWDNLLVPLSEWTIEEAAPAALDTMRATLDLLSGVIEKLKPWAVWLWEEFLQPIAEWTGETIIDALNELTDLLRDLSDLLSGEISFTEFIGDLTALQTVLLSLAAVLGTVKLASTISNIATAISNCATSVATLTTGLGTITGIATIVGGAILAVTNFVAMLENEFSWLNEILMVVGIALVAVGAIILGAPALVVGVVAAIVAAVLTAVVLIKDNWEAISTFFSDLWENISTWATNAWDSIKTAWSTVKTWFSENIITPVKNVFSDMWDRIKSAASGTWSGIKTVFTTVKTWFSEKVISPVKNAFSGMWDRIKSAASGTWSGIKTVFTTVKTWFSEKVISPVKNVFSGMWDGLKTGAKNAWSGVKSVFSSVATFFKDTFKKAWNGIVSVFSTAGEIFTNIKDGILTAFKNIVNSLIKGLNKVIAVPFEGINKALKAIKDINILGLTPFSGLKTISVPEIPYLAKGAVIPPNAPFMAVLGDQRHGTNIEAPADLIRKIVREEIGDNSGSFAAAAQEIVNRLDILIGTVDGIEVGDTTIGQAANRYNEKKAIMTGGFA